MSYSDKDYYQLVSIRKQKNFATFYLLLNIETTDFSVRILIADNKH